MTAWCMFLAASMSALQMAGKSSRPASGQTELVGLWKAKRIFGPEVRGTLTLTHERGWSAEIMGYRVDATVQEQRVGFEIPGHRGEFRASLPGTGGVIEGYWVQPKTIIGGGQLFASPVTLMPLGQGRWRGQVVPLNDELTLYLLVATDSDGSTRAVLRNPERNIGHIFKIRHLERDGNAIRLTRPQQSDTTRDTLAIPGSYREVDDRLSLFLPEWGGTYDFIRIDSDPASGFYGRGRNPPPYQYRAPSAEPDGWVIGRLDDVGMTVDSIRSFIETVVYRPVTSVHDPDLHALLIARHGKLVLEEYFHGFHRELPHDTRSASKSLASTLIGAAIAKGVRLTASSPVYSIMYRDTIPSYIDPRKRRITLEHLLTMSAGLDCDDFFDRSSKGREDVLQGQTTEPDWYRYTLELPMVREPGKQALYCSALPNLAGGVLQAASGRSLHDLVWSLIAEPLQIRRYYLNLTPTGTPFFGGGSYWLPRDFMKLAQLMVSRGVWNGRRVVSEDWATRSTSRQTDIRLRGNQPYGYLWWNVDYAWHGKTIRGFFASGNGGQIVMGIPALDLVVAFYAGNYNDGVFFRIQDEFVPRYILPAIKAEKNGP